MSRFKGKEWLFLLIAFALSALCFILPFQRLAIETGGVTTIGHRTGLKLIDGAKIALDSETTVKQSALLDAGGASHPDTSYIASLALTGALVGLAGALLDRRGRRKGGIGVVCAFLTLALSIVTATLLSGQYAPAEGVVSTGALYSITTRAAWGLYLLMAVSALALVLSVLALVSTRGDAAPAAGQTKIVTRVGVLAAIAAVLFYMPGIPIIPPIYKLDFSSVPVLLAGFSMGPVPALCVLLIKDLVGLVRTTSAGVGELADFMTTAAMMLTAVAVYRRHRTLKGALIGLLLGVAAIAVVGAVTNYFIMIPFYVNVMNMPLETIVSMIGKVVPAVDSLNKLILLATTPFNLLKGLVLAFITFLLYKRLSPLLK